MMDYRITGVIVLSAESAAEALQTVAKDCPALVDLNVEPLDVYYQRIESKRVASN